MLVHIKTWEGHDLELDNCIVFHLLIEEFVIFRK
jgi:hypothetical protein